jgi:hypothetical protein
MGYMGDEVFVDDDDDEVTTAQSPRVTVAPMMPPPPPQRAPQWPRTSSINKKKTTTSKRVQFGAVNIYYCAVALGDSPSVSCGPPICLGNIVGQTATTINQIALANFTDSWFAGGDRTESRRIKNDFNTKTESRRAKEASRRREMKLTSDERVMMLLAAGVTRKDIEMAAVEAWEARCELITAIQRRRVKKERSDTFRRFFTTLFSRQDEAILAEAVASASTNASAHLLPPQQGGGPEAAAAAASKSKRPIVRAAVAC